ncbi:hypothetical protein J7M22_12295 [Candidatus Poribacteria bacterium]|nr:hypothetical protein [Candidatus Poribacteria bacterium]
MKEEKPTQQEPTPMPQETDDEFKPVPEEEKPERQPVSEPTRPPIRIAGFELTPETIRRAIVIGEILKRKF